MHDFFCFYGIKLNALKTKKRYYIYYIWIFLKLIIIAKGKENTCCNNCQFPKFKSYYSS